MSPPPAPVPVPAPSVACAGLAPPSWFREMVSPAKVSVALRGIWATFRPPCRFSLAQVHSQSRKDQVAQSVMTQARSGDPER